MNYLESIQNDYERIANAKTDLINSIKNKGTTVPEGAKIDELSALVDGIETGGVSVETCSVTIPESYSYSNKIYYLSSDLTLESFNLGSAKTIEVVKNSMMVCEKDSGAKFSASLAADSGVQYLGQRSNNSYMACVITNDADFYFAEGSEIA